MRAPYDLWCPETGEVIRATCRRYVCEPCRQRRIEEWPYILAAGRPERLVTLTLAPEDRERRRGQVRELAYRLRKQGYETQWAWNTERNPKGTGYHIHLLQHGDYIPQRVLQRSWGGRRVDIRRITAAHESAALYLLKEGLSAAGYIVKESYSLDGRPVHLSRGFLRGLTVAQARATLKAERFGEAKRWVPVSRDEPFRNPASAEVARCSIPGFRAQG